MVKEKSKWKNIRLPLDLFKDLNKRKGSLSWADYIKNLLMDSQNYRDLLNMTQIPPETKKKTPELEKSMPPQITDLYCPELDLMVKSTACLNCPGWRRSACEEARAKGEIRARG